MAGHCFISYSNRDAGEFGPQLSLELEGGHPYIETWYDKKDIPAGQKWDSVIHKAVSDCKCFLFVVTHDSITDDSICMRELSLALSYKKPIFPICLEPDVEFPWRVRDFQRIDFCGNHRKGMAQLRLAIQRVDSPEGQLDALRERLAVAERDLHNAKDEANKLLIEKDIEELTAQIRVYEKVAENPEAAKRLTEQNIQNGLERERKPEKPLAAYQSSKFINQPPGFAQPYFQDREVQTELVITFLKDEAKRLLTVVGRGGAGKTAMICRLLKYIENGGLPNDYDKKHGRVDVDGIVYLSEAGSRKVNFANLFEDLCKLLPAASAEKLSALYREPQTSTESKTVQLLAAFQGAKQVIVLLDNFENVVDAEKGQVRDAELDEALRAFLHAPHHPVKIIITTRVSARELDTFEPARQRLLPLDTGLQPEYAREAFVLMDEGNLVGIKNAGAELLNLAVTRTLGLPRALEALYAALRTDRFTTLQELLDLPILPEQVVQAYVGEAFNRLDTNAQKALQALAVYNRPVTPAAVDYLLAPHLPAIDSAPILQRLANMHFARKESGRFYLHPVDREFAFGLIPQESLTAEIAENAEKDLKTLRSLRAPRLNLFTQHDLTSRAADYFRQARKPRAEWKKLEDLSAQLAEFDLRCAAGDYDTAVSVLIEFDREYLSLWGHYRLMISLHEKVFNFIEDKYLLMHVLNGLETAYRMMGNVREAIPYLEQGLIVAKEAKHREAEGVFLGNLGIVYAYWGDALKAIGFYEQALVIAREIGKRKLEGNQLCNLGNRYATLGEAHKAIEFYEQSLVVAREIGNRESEGDTLHNLGLRHSELENIETAIEYYEQATVIHSEIGDSRGKSADCESTGRAFVSLNDFQKAKENYQQAIQISDEISYPQTQNGARGGLAEIHLFQNDLVNARATIEAALKYDVPENNHNASALHGIIALRQGDEVTARGAFVRAIGQADEILSKTAEYYSALDAKGLALCGLAVCGGRLTVGGGQFSVDGEGLPTVNNQPPTDYRQQAIEVFQQARKIAPHAGVVKSVLRLFDELVKCDKEGILKGVRDVIEGK